MTENARSIVRERCGKCIKQIYIGQSAIVCAKCDLIFHSMCLKNQKIFRDNIYCSLCIDRYDIVRYNPFHNTNRSNDQHDRFYDGDVTDFTDIFDNACQVLEECRQYSLTEANKILKTKSDAISTNITYNNNDAGNDNTSKPFSNIFFNIDGSEKNFNKFVCDLKSIDYEFSVIGLAETNTDPTNKDLYRMDGYTSVYQSVKEGKHKGTGVGLYVNDKYNCSEISDISTSTENLESLFLKITNLDEPSIVGVVYRPPSGNADAFQSELSDILSGLPADHTVHILGDFNVDLLSEGNHDKTEFENVIFTAGFTPLISTHTHHRNNCRKTCIDNIITNNSEQVIVSGTIENDAFHKPITAEN